MEFKNEVAFANKCNAKRHLCRRIMEAQGDGEVRRLHIVYFLSRRERIEHPHLIRVHHLSRNGVHLRDVKRWLSELRGKDVAESFSWSYKRKYKTGYVWQDLHDDDLITPVSDNEYVLKGSEISFTTFNNDLYSRDENEAPMQKEPPHAQVEPNILKPSYIEEIQEIPKSSLDISTKTSSEIEEESPSFLSETSIFTDDSSKVKEKKESGATIDKKQEENHQKQDFENTCYSNFLNKKIYNGTNFSSPSTTCSSNSSSFTKSRSYSSGASKVFRNLITCRGVETINRRSKTASRVSLSKSDYNKREMNGFEKLGRSQRQQQNCGSESSNGMKGSKKSTKNEFNNQKTASATYKTINWPNCSLCGKQFKPENLYTHMKSCSGMKAFAMASSTPFFFFSC